MGSAHQFVEIISVNLKRIVTVVHKIVVFAQAVEMEYVMKI